MRYCHGETVKVYESYGENLSVLLRDAAGVVDAEEGYANIQTSYAEDGNYTVILYIHTV